MKEHTDEELLNWWGSLKKDDKLYLLEKMAKSQDRRAQENSVTFMNMWLQGWSFSPNHIALIREQDV